MKLTDLEPRWVTPDKWCDPGVFAIGMSFLCPHCPVDAPEHGPERRRRLVVMFFPPIDPSRLQEKYGEGWWPKRPNDHNRISGETFETLTITPSIGFDAIGHWHGYITNGECAP